MLDAGRQRRSYGFASGLMRSGEGVLKNGATQICLRRHKTLSVRFRDRRIDSPVADTGRKRQRLQRTESPSL
jgi:hypothetical protein